MINDAVDTAAGKAHEAVDTAIEEHTGGMIKEAVSPAAGQAHDAVDKAAEEIKKKGASG